MTTATPYADTLRALQQSARTREQERLLGELSAAVGELELELFRVKQNLRTERAYRQAADRELRLVWELADDAKPMIVNVCVTQDGEPYESGRDWVERWVELRK